MKILHVITGLSTGGAEVALAKLVARLAADGMEQAVVSLTGGGPIADRIAALGVPVTLLNMPRGLPSLPGFVRLVQIMRRQRPDVVQGWMYHANLTAGLAAKLAGRPRVIWGIHHSDLDPRSSKRTTIIVAKLGARWSRWLPARIVCCGEVSRTVHEAMGYAADRMTVIPNGFDLDVFRPRDEARLALRRELGLTASTALVGLVARFDPQKDHRGFLAAAGIVKRHKRNVKFVLCGERIDGRNDSIAEWIAGNDLEGACHLLGLRQDIPDIMAGCDIVVSASAFGEGLPNVLGEAMASETPCVATNVGDSRLVVGDTGRIVPPRDPAALAAALDELLSLSDNERRELGRRARARIAQYYEMSVTAARHAMLYRDTVAARG